MLAARPENRAYFFDRLENPEWVSPLAAAGFFDDPPAPVPAGQPGYVRFPPWPEGRYLARVAPLVPGPAAALLQRLPRSENPVVARHALETLISLPDPEFRATSVRVVDWLDGMFIEYFVDEATASIGRMLQVGDLRSGLEAAGKLLEVLRDPRHLAEADGADVPFQPRPEVTARLSAWNYDRAIEKLVGPVTDSGGLDGLRFFMSLLDDALRHSERGDEPRGDLSYLWRPAVEDHEQNSESNIRDRLVSAVRDVALRMAARGGDDLVAVVAELEARSLIHQRIALYVLATSSGAGELVDERIGDRKLFDDYRLKHEYATLLRLRFGEAGVASRARFDSWVHQGPDLEQYRSSRERVDGHQPTDEEVEHFALVWARDWLSYVAAYLDDERKSRYEDLVAQLGPPEHPDFLTWSSSWAGPQSPVTQDDLAGRSVEETLDFLRTWQPADDSGWHFGPSIEGLGRTFSELVTARPAEFASVAASAIDLNPTYVRCLLSGLETSIRNGEMIAWDGPLTLAGFVVMHPLEPDAEPSDRGSDPGWRWCRREIASFLRLGFADRDNQIPLTFRAAVWSMIERLTADPNPSPEHEERYGGANMDPLTLSLNTNRGAALHAVIEYALWIRRGLEAAGEVVSTGFGAMPEVRVVLEQHLVVAVDPSLAVRAVYGRWLPWLLLLDERWVVDHLTGLFPVDEAHVAYRDTVWQTYLAWCAPFDSVFRALHGQYTTAIERIPTGATAGRVHRVSVDHKLGEHLVTFYWRGLADPPLVDDFFRRADDAIASDVMEFVGRALANTEGEVESEVGARIQDLWDRRLANAKANPKTHLEELRAFGATFASGKLDPVWALANLEQCVTLAGAPRVGHLVVKRLAAIASAEPAAAARILASMLARTENDWDHIGWREEAKAVVIAASRSGGPSVGSSCASIVDYYVTRDALDFRELLQPPNIDLET